MVKIRLARSGAKKRPFFPIVVTDSRTPRDGQGIEKLGFFNPIAKGGEERLRLNLKRLDEWLQHGAQTSARVATLIKEAKAGPEKTNTKRAAQANRRKALQAQKKAPTPSPGDTVQTGATENSP